MAVYYPYMGTGATCNQIATPLVYDESLSVAQQIARIFGALKRIEETSVGAAELQALREYFDAMQNAQTDALEKYADAEVKNAANALLELIEETQKGMMLWNVVLGRFHGNTNTMRDMFNDLAVHAIDVDTLAGLDMDVAHLSECGLNVRGLAVFSGYLLGEEFRPLGVVYEDEKPLDGRITCRILAEGEVKDGYFVKGA